MPEKKPNRNKQDMEFGPDCGDDSLSASRTDRKVRTARPLISGGPSRAVQSVSSRMLAHLVRRASHG